MSKKYFINNLDTPFGQALLNELVKEPTEDPVHMCTVRVPVPVKPSGIKKVLKREKPKLFRKKVIEECEVYVYSLDQTELTDIDFAIETMGKPFEDNKVFILVSDIMVWSNSPRKVKKDPPPPPPENAENAEQPADPKPEEPEAAEEGKEDEEGSEHEMEVEEKPIEYTFYEEGDYEARVPLPNYQFMREVEDKVLGIKRENVKVFVVCPGIIYGCGENTFYPLFKAAWLQEPAKLPHLG
jgi:adenylate kinase